MHTDVVVVGAGPGGSATAAFIAQTGRDVVLIEKEAFPREKVCGDGLTPRAVQALRSLGLHAEAEGDAPGWARQSRLRMYGGGVVLDLPWPELDDWPAHSLTATRSVFDQTLAEHAVKAGAHLWEQTEATAPVYLDGHDNGRVAGVAYRRADGTTGVIRSRVVVAADGGSSRFAVGLGLRRLPARPIGVAVRAYYRSPRAGMDAMEGFLDMRQGEQLLPGYGWIFPLDGGLVNVGWGLLNTSEHFRTTNYRKGLDEWVERMPAEWGINRGSMVGTPRSAGLPMGHNRKPLVHRGVVLVGDAGGMVNPFNGEGISYAIESAQFAATAIDAALAARSDTPLDAYPAAVARAWGGYYTLGRLFVRLIAHPQVMRYCTEIGMPRRTLMQFVFRLMAHLVNRRPRDLTDVVVATLSRAVPAA